MKWKKKTSADTYTESLSEEEKAKKGYFLRYFLRYLKTKRLDEFEVGFDYSGNI